MDTTIHTEFSKAEVAYGAPRRVNRKSFELRDVIEPYSIGTNYVSEKKQLGFFSTACRADPGWFMTIACSNDLETGRLIAANIASEYLKRQMRFVWQNLGNQETVKSATDHVSLVVIDGLFDDSPAFRRDRVYDLITYSHDRPTTSIILVARSRHPEYLSKFLGLRPNFALSVTK